MFFPTQINVLPLVQCEQNHKAYGIKTIITQML